MTRETFEKQFGFTPIVDVQLGKAEEFLLLNGDEGTPLKQ